MESITKPILLNETGEKIVNAINDIAAVINNKKNAVDIDIADTGKYYEATTVEGALAESAENIATIKNEINNIAPTSSSAATYFYIDGTYTVPDGVTKIYVSGCGGGAGGSAYCGGGGAQSVVRKIINVTPGEFIPVTIGEGGNGTSYYCVDTTYPSGGDGTNTVFGTYLTLHGGYAAQYDSTTSRITQWAKAGGNGGTAGVSGSVQIQGDSTIALGGGNGGSSLFGVGGNGGMFDKADTTFESYLAGGDGIGYGSGGGGGCVLVSGKISAAGSGTNGILIIEEV